MKNERLKHDLKLRIEWNAKQVEILNRFMQYDISNVRKAEMDKRLARYEAAIIDYKNQLKKL